MVVRCFIRQLFCAPCNKPQSSRNPKTYTAFSADPEQTEQLQMSALYVCLSRTEIIYASLPQAAGYPHLIPIPQTAIMGNPNWCIYLLCQLSRKPPASCCIYSILQVTQPLALPIGNGSIVSRTSRKLGHFNINSDT